MLNTPRVPAFESNFFPQSTHLFSYIHISRLLHPLILIQANSHSPLPHSLADNPTLQPSHLRLSHFNQQCVQTTRMSAPSTSKRPTSCCKAPSEAPSTALPFPQKCSTPCRQRPTPHPTPRCFPTSPLDRPAYGRPRILPTRPYSRT